VPLEADIHAVAFARVLEDRQVVCLVPRLSERLTSDERVFPIGRVWEGRVVRGFAPGRYRDVLTGQRLETDGVLELTRAFARLPLALLVKEQG
jgi:maltooligosyltrehalose synthase